MRSSNRFQQWLSDAQTELQTLSIEEGNCTGQQLGEVMGLLGEEREMNAVEVMGRMREGAEEEEEEDENDGVGKFELKLMFWAIFVHYYFRKISDFPFF